MENEFKTKLAEFKDGKGTFHSIVQISDNIFHDKETGYLYCKNSILGGTGVQKYYGKEIGLTDEKAEEVIEMVRESVDVFDSNSMSTFNGKPVTLHHPKGKVNSKNFKKFIVGALNDAKQDNDNQDNLIGDFVIYDEYTIDKVMKGDLKDLSLGYRAKVVPMADGRYKQTEIVINHLAIVEEGRAEMATIVDGKTVIEEETILEPKDFKDKIHVTESKNSSVRVNTYDDETGEETTKEFSTFESKHSHYDEMKQQMMDHKPKTKEKYMEKKNFKYFMAELKDLAAYPKTEFRDKAYVALNDECKETLGASLPTFEEMKVSSIENSVGFVDTKKTAEEEAAERLEKEKNKTLTVYAQAENTFFDRLYRKMDDPKVARKYANMTYRDVYDAIREGSTI